MDRTLVMSSDTMFNEASIVVEGPQIDFTRRFIAEEFTPLFHTREYHSLPDPIRLRYNQLHALYFNEQVAFFEQEMLSPALLAMQRERLPSSLAAGLLLFFEEEQRHTAMFRALNRRGAPELYKTCGYHFIRVGAPWRALLSMISSRPRLFPLLLWLALLQEERSLYYSRGCLEKADELEPSFIAAHRRHLADEVGHIGWDEEWLDWLWPQIGRTARILNARLLGWMIGEFFLLPKRSAWHVVRRLAREFPQLDAAALDRAMRGLESNAAYPGTLYSREIAPRTFARCDANPEFKLLAQMLSGKNPNGFTQ
jgi:P-aminobenzoate N-oxygenase AurF